jgi:hypothetical protein
MPEISLGKLQRRLKITTSKILWIAEEKEDPMTRGKRAPLSPHEEVTLRRIALGITQAPHKSDIKRLKALSLIEENGGGLGLTPMGSKRYLSLQRAPPSIRPIHRTNLFRSWPKS